MRVQHGGDSTRHVEERAAVTIYYKKGTNHETNIHCKDRRHFLRLLVCLRIVFHRQRRHNTFCTTYGRDTRFRRREQDTDRRAADLLRQQHADLGQHHRLRAKCGDQLYGPARRFLITVDDL